MRIKSVSLRNYRNFKDYYFELGEETTILIGRNGMGKTNLICSMVQALSFIFSKQRNKPQTDFIRSSDQGVRRFSSTDPYFTTDYQYPLSITASAKLSDISETPINWSLEQDGRKSGLKDSLFRTAYQTFWNHYNSQGEKPVLAFFSDGFPHKNTRISAAMKERLKSGNQLPPNTGYYQWDQDQSCVEIWKKYFSQQWLNNRLVPDPAKESYVSAITTKLKEFSLPLDRTNQNKEMIIDDLYVEVRDNENILMIKFFDGTVRPYDSLPQGYNRIFSIVFDLANRSYLLNGNCNPEGIVFIDEIELHLHPSIAIEILQRLRHSFNRIQFIISTHSPLVITNFNQKEEVNGIKNRLYSLYQEDGIYRNRIIHDIFGLDYNSGLTSIMQTSDCNRTMKELKQLYNYWKKKNPEKADIVADYIRGNYSNNIAFIKSLGL